MNKGEDTNSSDLVNIVADISEGDIHAGNQTESDRLIDTSQPKIYHPEEGFFAQMAKVLAVHRESKKIDSEMKQAS